MKQSTLSSLITAFSAFGAGYTFALQLHASVVSCLFGGFASVVLLSIDPTAFSQWIKTHFGNKN
jgi:hypothetical protein